jgi:hypothetical protein
MQWDEYKDICNSGFVCELTKHHLQWDTHNCNIFHVLQFTLHISVIIELQIMLALVKPKNCEKVGFSCDLWNSFVLFLFYLITIFLSHTSASSYLFNDSVVGFLQLSYTLQRRLLPRHTIFFSSWIYSQWRNSPRHVSLCLMKCKETFLSNIANSAGISSTEFTHDCLSH